MSITPENPVLPTIAVPPGGNVGETEPLVSRLAEEMVEAWRAGRRLAVEHFLNLHPHLWNVPAAVMDLLYEEICLCHEYGQEIDSDVLAKRFPRWQAQVAILLNCVQALQPAPPAVFPDVGDTLGDFHLEAELGRGGQGRVFMATQSSLGGRPVVLKISSRRGDEHLSLARLQHTHIVPLLSLVDEPGRNLRVLCMPYFGGLTVAALLARLDRPPAQRSGRDILQALDEARVAAPISLPRGRDPATPFLEKAVYVQAVAWLGACVAEALKFAHERGLVHLDVKPSNVLVTADGQPMLLDFHLAREPLQPGDPGTRFGGTPSYMSPEQKRGLKALREGRVIAETIDGRSDVYSLGLVLYEALGGEITVESGKWSAERAPLSTFHRPLTKPVPVGLSDIIAKCLAGDPADRYQDAGALAADLWAHLNDRPLKGVGNRSLVERWQKLRRRKPHFLSLVFLGAAVVAVGGAAVGIGLVHLRHRAAEARAALAEGQQLAKQSEYAAASAAFKRGLSQVEGLPWNQDLRQQLTGEFRAAARAQAARELHEVADRFRFLFGLDFVPSARLQELETRCRTFWDQRDLILERLGKHLDPALEERVRIDLLDLAILGTDLRVRLAGPDSAAAQKAALAILDQAEALFGPSAVLSHERQRHALALGLVQVAADARRRQKEQTPRSAWEHYSLGRALMRANNLEAAVARLERAVALQPEGLWPNFYYGVCCYRLGRFQDAAIAFTVSTTVAPQVAGCFYNRGLAFAGLGQNHRARADFDRALQLKPAFAEAALNRGILHLKEKRRSQALADLQRAFELGGAPTRRKAAEALKSLQDRPWRQGSGGRQARQRRPR